MALKQLILSNKRAKALLKRKGLLDQQAEQEKRKNDLTARSQRVNASLEELTKRADPPTEEEQNAVDEELAAVGADVTALEAEQAQTAADLAAVEAEITELEQQLDAIQEQVDQVEDTAEGAAQAAETEGEDRNIERSMIHMRNRNQHRSVFAGLSIEQRSAIIKDKDVQAFLGTVRSAIKEKRTISNVGITIPNIILPLIEQVWESESQLLPYVHVENLNGTGRQTIMGDIPEAIWTEMCATLNEMALAFNMVEVDGFKLGGFIPVCNAILEDNDVSLAIKVFDAIAKGMAYATDKAIIFGTGTKMPLGIYTRLAQTDGPSDADPAKRPWVDLHTSNVKTIASEKTGAALYKELLTNSGVTSNRYARGGKFWAMNEATRLALMAEMLSVNAAGAIVIGVENTMPVIGGDIVVLEFMPANMIVGGYGRSYLFARRAGMKLASSDEHRFIQDQTVFKGTARADGKPVFPESFVAIGIGGTEPSATGVTFAADTANA